MGEMMTDYWNLDNRPNTRTKLKIFEKCFNIWLTIWNKQEWAHDELYYIDLFAGKGEYYYKNGVISGSPLIFLEQYKKLRASKSFKNKTIKMLLVEKDRKHCDYLKQLIENYIVKESLQNSVCYEIFNDDCNNSIDKLTNSVRNEKNVPLLLIIDPFGINIKKDTLNKLMKLNNCKDIFFNYMLEGVRRTGGVYKSSQNKDFLCQRELSTIQTLKDFLGDNLDIIEKNDLDILKFFVEENFTKYRHKTNAMSMEYPNRNDIVYYLLFICRKERINEIIEKIFRKELKKYEIQKAGGQLSLFESDHKLHNF